MDTALLEQRRRLLSRNLNGRARPASPGRRLKWNFAEWFVISQTFIPALLYLPGSQPFRIPIRLASYAITLFALVYYLTVLRKRKENKGRPQPAIAWLVGALAYLTLMLAHPNTNSLLAGSAQIGLYFSVLSPVFWAPAFVKSPERLKRLLWILLICNGVNSFVGVMQVRDPDRWMPREFSSVVLQSAAGIDSLTYIGPDGRRIMRPPGLSDAPGAVCGPAVFAVLLGLVFAMSERKWWRKALAASFAGLGVAAILFSLVRSSLLIAMGMVFVYLAIQVYTGRGKQAGSFALVAAAIGMIAFGVASSVGGQSIVDRFATIQVEDKGDFYMQNRGNQVIDAFTNQLPAHPLGSGLGRWGMMSAYFGDKENMDAQPIWVEIQWPAFIVDGGIILLVLYSGALVAALHEQGKTTFSGANVSIRYLAAIIFAANCGIVALCFSYPVFLSPIGMQFWFLTGALRGTALGLTRESTRPATARIRRLRLSMHRRSA